MEIPKLAKNFKSRYFTLVLYPESMIDDWQTALETKLQLPCCYCIHDKDLDNEKDERKVHVHLIVVANNTTTAQSIYESVIMALSKDDCLASPPVVEKVNDIRNMYEYLIHNSKDAIKKKKHKYSPSERICLNNFDIGSYEQLGVNEKNDILKDIYNIIIEWDITNFDDLIDYAFMYCDSSYTNVIFERQSLINNILNARWQKKSGQYKPCKDFRTFS